MCRLPDEIIHYKNCTVKVYNDGEKKTWYWGFTCRNNWKDLKALIDDTVMVHNNWLVTVRP